MTPEQIGEERFRFEQQLISTGDYTRRNLVRFEGEYYDRTVGAMWKGWLAAKQDAKEQK